jgi:hypothetical protein
MNLPKPTLLQCNWVLGLAAILLLLSAFISRLLEERICTLVAVLASVAAVYLPSRGFGSRLRALLRVGFAYLAASWCAYGLWHFHIVPQFHPTTGIDPFTGPLGIMAIFNFVFGLTTWFAALWVNRKGPYVEHFIRQRVFWTLGAVMIFTSSHFFEHIAGV